MANKKTKKVLSKSPARTVPASRARAAMSNRLRELGVMRLALLFLTVVLLISAPPPGTPPVLAGWPLWPTLIVPTLAPILFMVLMLDALMARVMMTSVKGAVRDRYRRIVIFELVQGAVLLLYWLPYFVALTRG